MEVNPDRLNAFMGKVLGDVGAAANAPLIRIGDRLGIYKALAAAKGPMTPKALAAATCTAERYIREWLSAQAASGYVDYDAASKVLDECRTGDGFRRRGQPSVLGGRGRPDVGDGD